MWQPYFKNTRWDTGSVKCQYLEKTRRYDQEKATLAAEGKEKRSDSSQRRRSEELRGKFYALGLESEAGT